MTDTGYDYADDASRLVPPHVWTMEGLKPVEPFPVMVVGDGGLYSTAQDYARFLQCLLAGGAPLLRPETFSSMIENQIGGLVIELQPEGHPAMTRPFPNNAGTDTFGLGFQLDNTGAAGLRSKGSYSWSGLFNTHFWGDPVRGVGGIILMQMLPFYDPRCMALAEAFERGVYRL
jgi:CubicO group peptidase (beta-lactamase class C family)